MEHCQSLGRKTIDLTSVNKKLAIKSFTIMLSDFELATIIQACIRSATITDISCIAYLIWNFSPLLGILIMWEMV